MTKSSMRSTKRIMERVQAGGEAFLSGTVLRGRFALRACILHYGTTEDDLSELVEIVRRAAELKRPDRLTGSDQLAGAGNPCLHCARCVVSNRRLVRWSVKTRSSASVASDPASRNPAARYPTRRCSISRN